MKQESITIISKRMKKKIRIADILYIIKSEYLSLIHLIDGDILQTITPIYELKEMLGDDCIEVKKGCIVSVSAITNIKDKIYLCNGEAIDFTVRRRKAVRLEWREKQKLMIDEINGQNPPRTDEEYHKYYEICDKFPFAFTDIEMVFNEKRHAVDWIFRYGNEALAELEGVPLKEMIGSTFQTGAAGSMTISARQSSASSSLTVCKRFWSATHVLFRLARYIFSLPFWFGWRNVKGLFPLISA